MIAAVVLVLATIALTSAWLVRRLRRLRTEDVAHLIAMEDSERYRLARGRAGLGPLSMRERALLAGGRMGVRSSAGRGTRIQVTIRLNRESVRARMLESALSAHPSPP